MFTKYRPFRIVFILVVLTLILFSANFTQSIAEDTPKIITKISEEEPSIIVAKTSIVVVNATFIREPDASPSEVIDYDVTHYLRNVNYIPGAVTWEWGPLPTYSPWPQGSTVATGRIWAWRTPDNGKIYEGLAWDYITNSTTHKGRANDVPNWIGTMISSLCHTNSTCNATERTRIEFFPGKTIDYNNSEDTELISLKITPSDVGIFYENETQQFKAMGITPDGTIVDLTNQVDWFIDPSGFPYKNSDQDMSEGAVVTINSTGLATVHDTWGRVMVNACYPKGCHGNSATLGAIQLLLLNH